MNKALLIAYFSRPGNNYVNGSIVNLHEGNTETAVKKIHEMTGGPLPEMFSKYFIGQAYLQLLTDKGGQILLCTEGRGWYQAWGEEPRELHPGDVVNIPPEVKHWHGAAKDNWFANLAVEIPAEGASNEWLEPVNDEAYGKLK